MKEAGLLQYKDALKEKAISNSSPIRIGNKGEDIDLEYFGDVLDPYRIDIGKILGSKAIRREMDKTQVFYNPGNSHIRNRMSHTLEVVNISTTISDVLGLNTNLCEAIALGHDIGHGPTGHLFESVVKEELKIEFLHEAFSAITAIFIERNGAGLNLTKETIEGILKHSYTTGELFVSDESSNESNIVMHSDKIAFLFSDINDFKRLDFLLPEKDLSLIDKLSPGNQKQRVSACVGALIKESAENGGVLFKNSQIAQNFQKIKEVMYKNYAKLDNNILKESLKAVLNSVGEISELNKYDPVLVTALMTDKELDILLNKIISSKRINLTDLRDFGVYEIIDTGFLEGKTYQGLEMELRQKLEECNQKQ